MQRRIMIALLAAVVALAGLSFQPAAAQSGTVWSAQFYNNLTLGGDPVTTVQYGSVSLNWGTAAPAPGVNADNFTARISTDAFFQAGTYRFYVVADDAFQLWIDFPPSKRPEFTTFDAPRPGTLFTIDLVLSAGSHHVQFDFKELGGDAYLYASWANLATNPTAPNFPIPTTSAVSILTAPWTAQYYNNQFLSGTPVVTQSEASPSHNWGEGVPVTGLPADGFSVRWTSVQTLNGGTYQFNVKADDGVRVLVNGSLLLNEWHLANGQTYTPTFTVPAGAYTFVVEYYDQMLAAHLDFGLTLAGGSPVIPPPVTGASATVLAYRLNVRSAPSTAGSILTRISRNETYAIVGRNAASTWWQLNVNGTVGWVFGRYIAINNEQGVPVTDGSAPAAPAPTGLTLTARTSLNIRGGPGVTFAILGRLPYRQSAQIVGRNSATTWYQIQYGALTGWVSGFYVDLAPGTNVNTIPVTG